jgi:excisionase family DNA binding protein
MAEAHHTKCASYVLAAHRACVSFRTRQAELLSVSPKTVSRWAKEGKLPFMKTLGGHRRYPEAQIRRLVDELRQEPTA